MEYKVGVLALQGGVAEHVNSLSKIPQVTPVLVKKPAQLGELSALIIPGGESTTIAKLIDKYDFRQAILDLHADNKPLWGTCAGLILLAKEIEGGTQKPLGIIDIKARRNAFGRQLDSFITDQLVPEVSKDPVELVFIRAPIITQVGAGVKTLVEVRGYIVAAQQNNVLVSAFHPELTEDISFHRYFVSKIKP